LRRTDAYRQCTLCKRYVDMWVNVVLENKEETVCFRCFLSYTLHETIRDLLRSGKEEDIKDAVRVLEGINDLVEDNPYVQGIRHVIDFWAHTYPKPVFIEDIKKTWFYKPNLEAVMNYLAEEQIFDLVTIGNNLAIKPGAILVNLLKLSTTNKKIYTDIVKAITGLATVRYLVEPSNPKLRYIYATLQAIRECIDNSIAFYEIKKYRCRKCEKEFATLHEIRLHIAKEHSYENLESGSKDFIEEVKGDIVGYLCKQNVFVEKAGVYGVHNLTKFLRSLITRGAIIAIESNEAVVEVNGEKYFVIDKSWIRVRERMRNLERRLIRQR
jgi:ACT domain-containing protein